jgi:hypothetical protein
MNEIARVGGVGFTQHFIPSHHLSSIMSHSANRSTSTGDTSIGDVAEYVFTCDVTHVNLIVIIGRESGVCIYSDFKHHLSSLSLTSVMKAIEISFTKRTKYPICIKLLSADDQTMLFESSAETLSQDSHVRWKLDLPV